MAGGLEGRPLWASLCLAACKKNNFAAAIAQHLMIPANLALFLFSVQIKSREIT
jgi:hypothetical protein